MRRARAGPRAALPSAFGAGLRRRRGATGTPSSRAAPAASRCWAKSATSSAGREANRCLLIAAGNGGIDCRDLRLRRQPAGTATRPSAAATKGGSPGPARTSSGRSPTSSAGQATSDRARTFYNLSLCHFKGGQLLASYGEPVGLANSYRHDVRRRLRRPVGLLVRRRTAARHAQPGRLPPALGRRAPSPRSPRRRSSPNLADPGRAVSSLAYHEGKFYEAVKVAADDVPNPAEEEAGTPSLPAPDRSRGGDAVPAAVRRRTVRIRRPQAGRPAGLPAQRRGRRRPLGDRRLGRFPARAAVLRLGAGGLDPAAARRPDGLLGSEVLVTGVAAEPGPGSIWVAFRPHSDPTESLAYPARLTRIRADGTLEPELTLPPAGDERGEAIGRKGIAGPIACPGAEQCWLATRQGLALPPRRRPGARRPTRPCTSLITSPPAGQQPAARCRRSNCPKTTPAPA